MLIVAYVVIFSAKDKDIHSLLYWMQTKWPLQQKMRKTKQQKTHMVGI